MVKQAATQKRGDGPSILIVDDDPLWRGFVQFLLELELKAKPETAASGADALSRLKHGSFDILISDLQMPGMTGLELLETVKQRHPQVKVIVLSADFEAGHTTPEKVRAMGAWAAIPKSEISSILNDVSAAIAKR